MGIYGQTSYSEKRMVWIVGGGGAAKNCPVKEGGLRKYFAFIRGGREKFSGFASFQPVPPPAIIFDHSLIMLIDGATYSSPMHARKCNFTTTTLKPEKNMGKEVDL